ncbi:MULTISPECIES: phosphocholine cytidylyltransferase family protein [unclassified Sphingomonas]|jgi:choline kinase|uniref:phosphocholine cytidylyltransferase family protein n=1 Tax=unclassified Sphingomonas TaxID=196159 RepID=UPI000829AE34|nr:MULTISPECIES: sugar phosphate nucleotidyltransferase [unclassified Sphingomonas]
MRGILLSAGSGSRLLPLTERVPKCLVELGGRAIIDLQLAALAQAGVREAVVIGGYRHEQLAAHLAASPPPLAVELRHNPFWAVASSIGSVWAARDLVDRPFCLMNGDTVFDADVIADAIARAESIDLLVEPIAAPELDDMLVTAAGGRVRAVAKTLAPQAATHRSLGVVIAPAPDRHYADALDSVICAPGGTGAFHHAIVDRLARDDRVGAIERTAGCWQEIDRPEDIARWDAGHGCT